MHGDEEKRELREKTGARAAVIRDQIAEVLEGQGLEVEKGDDDYGLGPKINKVDDIYVGFEIRLQYKNYFRGGPNGKLFLSFGNYGRNRRRTFPEPNAGYNISKIVSALTDFVVMEKEGKKVQEQKQQELDSVDKLVKELEPHLKRLGFKALVRSSSNIEISRLFSSPYELELFLQGIEKGNFSKGGKG